MMMSMVGNIRSCDDTAIDFVQMAPDSIVDILKCKSILVEPELSIDKAWQGIHFLLCDDPWEGKGPLSFILAGGESIGNVDVGYGPARSFKSSEVKKIAKHLNKISADDLAKKCKPEKFTENSIYPNIWDEPNEVCFSYILDYYDELKDFVIQLSEDEKGMIVYLS